MTSSTAFDVVAAYVEALAQRNHSQMDTLRAPDFVLDFVHGDAFADQPLTDDQTRHLWPTWFAAFSEMDFEVTRAIAAPNLVVVQWTFMGTHDGPLGSPIFAQSRPPTGRTVRFRGVSVYDVKDGLIQRETSYMDLVTLFVELGVNP